MTTTDPAVLILRENLRHCAKAVAWLRRSLAQASALQLVAPLSEEQLDVFEALAGRFARVADVLVHKVYRSLDRVELEPAGTLLDVLNRAAKRGILTDIAAM
jgi:hypothetical protein